MARKGELGEPFLSTKLRRKGISCNVFQRHGHLSHGYDVGLYHKLLWGTLCLVQWWNISSSFSQVPLTESCAFAKCCEIYQWSWDTFVDKNVKESMFVFSLDWKPSAGISIGSWNDLSPFLPKAFNYLHKIIVRTSIHEQEQLEMLRQFRHGLPWYCSQWLHQLSWFVLLNPSTRG